MSDTKTRPPTADPPAHTRGSRAAYWTVAASVALVLAASSTPSPLYVDYQDAFGFSSATVTAVYATYAAGVVVSLMLLGGLSDRIGRRRVLIGSVGLLTFGLLVFLFAQGTLWLYAARLVQGLATGVFTGAAGAALADLHPRGDAPRAAKVNTASQSLGIAGGAVLSGALAQWTPQPLRAPFLVLAVIGFVVVTAIVTRVPETVAVQDRAAGTSRGSLLRPQRLSVPPSVRRTFALSALGVIAAWSAAGLYLALGGSLAKELLGVQNHLVIGLVILSVQGVGGLCQVTLSGLSDRAALVAGGISLALGAGITSLALELASAPVFFLGNVFAGIGFGLAFLGATRSVSIAAPADRRGEVIAAYFLVAYVAISVPALLTGVVAAQQGLRPTFYEFSVVLAAVGLATAGFAARSRRAVS